jgi:hypothetical protein
VGAGLRGDLHRAEADLIMAEPVATVRDERGWFSSAPAISLLWAGILAGPVAWALDLTISYSIVKWTCGGGPMIVLHLITIVALLMTAGGAAASWVALQRVPKEATDDGPKPIDRGRFMALLGFVTCALFALAMIGNAIPRLLLDACL